MHSDLKGGRAHKPNGHNGQHYSAVEPLPAKSANAPRKARGSWRRGGVDTFGMPELRGEWYICLYVCTCKCMYTYIGRGVCRRRLPRRWPRLHLYKKTHVHVYVQVGGYVAADCRGDGLGFTVQQTVRDPLPEASSLFRCHLNPKPYSQVPPKP